jgi:hypothetical protein
MSSRAIFTRADPIPWTPSAQLVPNRFEHDGRHDQSDDRPSDSSESIMVVGIKQQEK